ncbi:MAG: ATP-binding protein [Gemmatimonadota bacterium]|nr:ATP-binding protein [Gemmatimonadota bacterium]
MRAISLLAAIAYPLFWYLHRIGGEVWLDPLALRLFISAYALGIAVLSYHATFVRRYLHRFLIGLVYLITVHFFVLLAINDLHWEFVLGILLVLIGMNAGSSLGFRSRRSLNAYLATVVAGAVVTVLVVEDPVVPVPYFLAAVAIATLTSFFGIGGQLKARGELLESRRRLQTVLTGAPIVFWSIDERGDVSAAEGQGLEGLGARPETVVGRPVEDLFGDEPDFVEATRGALEGEPTSARVEREGTFFETWQTPLRSVDGEVVGAVGVATDVTRLHHLSMKLRQAQKMEAIGRLAGGIAHDFNNILTAVLGYAQLARTEIDGDGNRVVVESLDEIRTASRRAADLVDQLLAFSRRQDLEPRAVDLNDLVVSMTSMLVPLVGEDLVLVTDLGDEIPTIEADPTGIEQILMNLAVNARDASPEGGTVRISTRGATVPVEDGPPAPESLTTGRYAVLEFSDEGKGMDPETVDRIFEPFFTTKPLGEGSGLGLATVYGVVQQEAGAIEVESEPGSGTTFTIWLPASSAALEAAPAQASGP